MGLQLQVAEALTCQREQQQQTRPELLEPWVGVQVPAAAAAVGVAT
jgi:hypothetical protein